MRTENVTIAGHEYEIAELPMRKNAAWRQELHDTLAPMADLMAQSQSIDMTASNAGGIFGIIKQAADVLITSPDTITDLVFSYSPALADDADHIRDEAYDSEIMDAFTRVLRLAYPFGRMLRRLSAVAANGENTQRTPTTSPS